MVTLTFAGDESGDVSFAFNKGASRYFVVAAIATAVPDQLRQLLHDLREQARLRSDYEFSFHQLSSASAPFEAWAVLVDKTTLPDTFRVMRRLDFYLYFVTELMQLIPAHKSEGATLILDEFGSAQALPTELRRFMRARQIARHFKRVLAQRSKADL